MSFVTSTIGQQVHESLEIIEDADEVEEEELDNINLEPCPPQDTSFDDISPMKTKDKENEEPKLA